MSAIWLFLTILFGILLLVRHSVEETIRPLQSAACRGLIVILDTDLLALCFIICFSFLCATRSIYSYDAEVYRDWYFKIIDTPFFRYDGEYGFVFEYVVKILSLVFGSNYRLVFFALPLINNLIIYKVLRGTEDVGTSGYLLYFCLAGFYYNFVVMRQGLAFTFIIWALASWNNKKKLFILLVLAALSHNTALLFLVFVIVVHLIRLGYHALLVIWILAFVNYFTQFTNVLLGTLVTLFEPFIPGSMKARYVFYFVDREPERVFSFYYLALFLILLFLIFRARQEEAAFQPVQTQRRRQIDDRRMLDLGIVGAVMLSVGVSFLVVVRLADYFVIPCVIFLLPASLKKLYIPYYKPGVLVVCLLSLVLYLRMFLLEAPLYLF